MSRISTSKAPELLLELRREDTEPLHRQLEHGLREAVRSGRLPVSAPLPSTRILAEHLGVSRGIVVEAYAQLIAEGYLASVPGGSTTVACSAVPTTTRAPVPVAMEYRYDFRPGRPDLAEFPRQAWLRSIRRVMDGAPSERFGYLDGRGMPELRHALAQYLDRVRGTCSDAEDVVICTGFAQGVGLVGRVLVARGARRVGMEDPSDADSREMLRSIGLDVVGIPVDTEGIRVDLLEAADVAAVVVTPAHQYPTGSVLSAERRAALVAWAEHRQALIIEDDYDAEYRYDREPIGSIQGLAPERVVYAGSASKVLAPGLRLGWLIAPSDIADAIAGAKKRADQGSPAIDQLAFADFLERGELDRHLRRVRPMYRQRRDLLIEALARHLPGLDPCGASAGLHLLAWLPPDRDERAILRAANEAGIGLSGVGERRMVRGGRGGLIFGYGTIPDSAIEPGVRVLAEVMAATR